jgi:C4-dicarboxylate-specific signal transduction histidine kinase
VNTAFFIHDAGSPGRTRVLNQPLTSILNNASAGRRFIAKGRGDLRKLAGLFEDVVADARWAGEIIRGIRGMVRKSEETRSPVSLNDVIASVVGSSAQPVRQDRDVTLGRLQGRQRIGQNSLWTSAK